jgi:ribonuclease PH
MVLKSMQTAAIISAYLALASAGHALATARMCDVPVGDAVLTERIDATVLELAGQAQKLNLEVHITE